jgi:hypothetical protein
MISCRFVALQAPNSCGGPAGAHCRLSCRSRARISSSVGSVSQPYAAKTASSSLRWARSSQVGRALAELGGVATTSEIADAQGCR